MSKLSKIMSMFLNFSAKIFIRTRRHGGGAPVWLRKNLWNFSAQVFLLFCPGVFGTPSKCKKERKRLSFSELVFCLCLGKYGGGALVCIKKRFMKLHGTCFLFYLFRGQSGAHSKGFFLNF